MQTVWAKSLDGGRMATTPALGLVIAGSVIACALSQFRYYFALTKLAESQFPGETERDRRFFKRQAWRRLQIAALSGIAGACMLAGLFVPYGIYPRLFALFWIAVALFGVWVVALALVDCVSTWLHFAEERQINEAKRLALRYKIDKFQKDALRARDELERTQRRDDDQEQE